MSLSDSDLMVGRRQGLLYIRRRVLLLSKTFLRSVQSFDHHSPTPLNVFLTLI